jgi:hypothetical protein
MENKVEIDLDGKFAGVAEGLLQDELYRKLR